MSLGSPSARDSLQLLVGRRIDGIWCDPRLLGMPAEELTDEVPLGVPIALEVTLEEDSSLVLDLIGPGDRYERILLPNTPDLRFVSPPEATR